jgi:hypothetical protein
MKKWRIAIPVLACALFVTWYATDRGTVQHDEFIDLGSIKRNIGDQNYLLSPNVDLSKYRAVSVWCKRFNVNFGTGPRWVELLANR